MGERFLLPLCLGDEIHVILYKNMSQVEWIFLTYPLKVTTLTHQSFSSEKALDVTNIWQMRNGA